MYKALLGFIVLLCVNVAQANLVLNFDQLNPNQNNQGAPGALGDQLTLQIADPGTGVTFVFTNPVGISSSITDVYFGDETNGIFSNFAITFESNGVDFDLANNPQNFPQVPGFSEVATADSGNGTNAIAPGVNAIGESLEITATYAQGSTYNLFLAALNSSDFRIGLQTRDNPTGGNPSSDRWMNRVPGAVPVPAALPLMASALGLFGIARHRSI